MKVKTPLVPLTILAAVFLLFGIATPTKVYAAETLTVTVGGTGSGEVRGNGSVICATNTSPCYKGYFLDDAVELTVNPGIGSTFTGWGGICGGTDPCNITMDQDYSVTATFSSSWNPPASPPPFDNADQPINVGPADQVKFGGLALTGVLAAPWVLATNKAGIGLSSADDYDPVNNPFGIDPAAALDVNGQIRIRLGDPGANKVLITDDTSGLARWGDPPSLEAVCVAPPGGECTDYSAIWSIDGLGVHHREFVYTLEAGATSGLTLTNTGTGATSGPLNGPLELVINVAAGTGDGLMIDETTNELKFEDCATDETWKFDGSNWNCSSFPAPSTIRGSSVMHLVRRDSTFFNCPAQMSSSPGAATQVNVGSGSVYNYQKICYSTSNYCQVFTLKASSLAGLVPCESASGWNTWPTFGNEAYEEYAPGGAVTNWTRYCYRCSP